MGYRLWRPRVVGTHAVELYLGLVEEHEIGAGTDAMVGEVLRAAGVSAAVTGWRLTACRSGYFSEDPTGSWEAHWELVFRLRAELAEAPRGLAQDPAPVGLYFRDTSWTRERDWLRRDGAHALVMCDFAGEAAARRAREALRTPGGAVITRQDLFPGVPQLCIDLGPRALADFTADLPEAAPLLEQCRRLGGSLRYGATDDRVRLGRWPERE